MTSLEPKIRDRSARISVLGLGYVGLPYAMAFAREGFRVTGLDIDRRRVGSLRAGNSYVLDVPSEEVRLLTREKKFQATWNPEILKDQDVVIICVPTPLNKSKDPDLSFIAAAVEFIAARLHRGQLVILTSTTYPGTTREYVLPRLEQTGLKVGQDFFLGFSPERIDPGNKAFPLRRVPKIVGGITPKCRDLAVALYRTIVDRVLTISSTDAAEMVKLLENTFRGVNIALVNEVAIMCEKLGIDAWEVIEAAGTKPYGFMKFLPGPGLGGHCIPIDPSYLAWKLRSLDYRARFIEVANEVNREMPHFVLQKVLKALNARAKSLSGAKILVLGVAYKKDVNDLRESPALDLIRVLGQWGARVEYHDPHIPKIATDGIDLTSRRLSPALLKSQDCVLIATDHSSYDWDWVVEHARLIVDTRNATASVSRSRSKIVQL